MADVNRDFKPVGDVGDVAEIERHSNVQRTKIAWTDSRHIATAV